MLDPARSVAKVLSTWGGVLRAGAFVEADGFRAGSSLDEAPLARNVLSFRESEAHRGVGSLVVSRDGEPRGILTDRFEARGPPRDRPQGGVTWA